MVLDNAFETKKFLFAVAKDRLLAKLFDFFALSIISLILGLLIFCFDKKFIWSDKWWNLSSWRYLVFGLVVYLTYFFWMLFFPFFFNWQTIGMKIFKLKFFTFKKNKKQMLKKLFLHDLFIWEITITISLILSLFLFFLSREDSKELLQGMNLFFLTKAKNNGLFFYFGLGFSVLYSCSFFVLCFIIFGIFLCNKHPACHDNISGLYIIKSVPFIIKKTDRARNNKPTKNVLPGVIDLKSLDEILDDNKK